MVRCTARPGRGKHAPTGMIGNNLTKSELRRDCLRQRRALNVDDWQRRSRQICAHLVELAAYRSATTLLAYFAFRQEPDLSPLWTDTAKSWGFPRCMGEDLSWHYWQPGQPLTTNAWGILEPHPDLPRVEISKVDLLLVPCVGFNAAGYRLGYGGGFYDRLLAQPAWAQIETIGIGFELGRLENFVPDQWDQPLSGICTELGYWKTGQHQV
jgi:5-formyltetrahydrofolate cyclo-ligase